MKLRRRRKEEKQDCHYLFCHPQPGRGHSLTPLLFPPPFIIPFFSPSTPPHHPASPTPAYQPPRVGRAIFPSYPSPAVLLLPFFFIKLPKQQNVAVVAWRSTLLADPASRPSHSMWRPARRTLAPPGGPLVLHLLRSLPSLGAVHPHRAKL